ncbi:hydroxyacylglutathione hydrolase [Alishewanella longhuensis]|uniref:Hydroxyacylglutathione hydrolase n=1 Tax=Alishewanella longhuensis TaxID=1091037 RepID=A0ABQ3KVN6_9ALTE|nr:hydroxyacylglutathione hydrolase [Alishewanella longhuensis]GHG64070.1 hydroxyacylglutathione hydrolase [Alishewanella longhuensis]
MTTIIPLPAFQDNYIWVLSQSDTPWCVVVDPGDASVVNDYLIQNEKKLLAVLITHHHADHTGGLMQLKQQWPELRIIGPTAEHARIPALTETVGDGAIVVLPQLKQQFQVIAIPGHTAGHIAFYSAPVLFCGDTLFSAGCGRLLEGEFSESAIKMYQSLQRLISLPETTEVYCTHEYTLANLRFALSIEPDNLDLQYYQQQCQVKRQNFKPTLPSNIGLEKKVNPFLRCNNKDLQLKHNQNSAQSLFAYLRMAKDQFKS